MHIGFDISQTGSRKTGCGFYAHALAQALLTRAPQHRYSLFPSFGDFYYDRRMPVFNPYPGRTVRYGPRHLSWEAARQFWTAPGLEAALGSPEIIHANNFWCPTQLGSSRLVYTLYDLAFVAGPERTTEANRVGCFEGVFRASIAADWVVAISEASRQHWLRVFPHFPQERVRVIHPCSRFADATARGRRPRGLKGLGAGSFWLSVGTIEPRKNQLCLARAYARYLSQGGEPMPLVLAGGAGWLMEDFGERLEELGIAAQTLVLGYVADEELVWLYRNCYANIYPSLFEGFGLPVLEGMQFGAATLTSRSTSLPEVAGEAAVLVDPEDVQGWAQAMLRLASGPQGRAERERLGAAAREQAARFGWDKSAQALLQLYEEALASPKKRMAA